MYAALFKNKWPLLAFLVITLAGVQLFVGERDWNPAQPVPQGLAPPLPESEAVAQEGEPVSEEVPDLDGFYSGAEDVEYVEEEELIDPAVGFDPTPTEDEFEEETPDDPVAEEDAAASGEPVP
jgi:hypothetical protein